MLMGKFFLLKGEMNLIVRSGIKGNMQTKKQDYIIIDLGFMIRIQAVIYHKIQLDLLGIIQHFIVMY